MGYCYGYTESGRQALVCDHCGTVGGVRKRTCTAKVLTDSVRSYAGNRQTLSYCYPPAYCSPCFKLAGGNKGLHGDCKAKAAESQAEYDHTEALFQSGVPILVSASGDWAQGVPKGFVRATFQKLEGQQVEYLIPVAEYQARGNGTVTPEDFETIFFADEVSV
jgi:hypothetical protein